MTFPDQKPAHPAPGSEAAPSKSGAASHSSPMDEALVATGGRAIADHIHRDGDFGMRGEDAYAVRKDEFDGMARAAIQAVQEAQESSLRPETVRIPVEPPPGLLMSMAIRLDHGLGMPGYYDQPIFGAKNVGHARCLEVALSDMRKVYEEVVGAGFYTPEREASYAALLPLPPSKGGGNE